MKNPAVMNQNARNIFQKNKKIISQSYMVRKWKIKRQKDEEMKLMVIVGWNKIYFRGHQCFFDLKFKRTNEQEDKKYVKTKSGNKNHRHVVKKVNLSSLIKCIIWIVVMMNEEVEVKKWLEEITYRI